MAEDHPSDFLPLPPREYPSDDDFTNPIQPALDTLFLEFSRRQRTPSPVGLSSSPRLPPPRRCSPFNLDEPYVDLRALDYTSDYDSHLMCPICHVPFIDPVVLECDHTFCDACLNEYRTGTTNDTAQCPSCRTPVLSSPKKASRLISNMCNDIKVCCPNEGCISVLARGYMERHVSKDCLEQLLHCADDRCEKQTKRKNYVPSQCIHDTHIECDCGAVIELGRGEWLKHKDEDCPNTGVRCEHCSQRIPARDYFNSNHKHDCQNQAEERLCPGREFGCHDEISPASVDEHIASCPLARLAPFLNRQSRLLTSLTEQLAHTKMRNEVLETGLERISGVVNNQLHSKTSEIHVSESDEIEEIERDHIPGTSTFHHRDLLLPAHVRDLTPSPTSSHSHPAHLPNPFHSPAARSTSSSTSHQHLLSLHNSLRNSITSLETDVHQLHINITELDARSSMQIMNETLRLKEELAHTNAALFSTRAQVQWLLNKERMGIGMGMMGPGMNPNARRQSSMDQTQNTRDSISVPHDQHATETMGEPSSVTRPGSSTSNQSSTTTSPVFGATNMSSTRRPSVRRHSGGSQERVKL